jgi:nicotinamidase-related amidase
MRAAIMVIDMQRAYRRGPGADSMDRAAEYINAALEEFRKRGLPVVWVQDKDEGDGVLPGTEGFELIEALRPAEGEERITKEYGNAFKKTRCAEILEKAGVDCVVITGYCAEHCVLATYRGGKDLDLFPIILRGGIASGSAENLGFVERISELISFGALLKALGDF